MKNVAITVFLLVLGMGTVHCQAKVELPGSQVMKLASSIVGQEYDIYVQLPGNYADTSKTFPVLYVLDGQWDFSLVTAIYGQQYYDGFVPAVIIVGITWGGTNPNYDMLRARDLTPTNVGWSPQSGGAQKFLAFIKNELIPFVESKYRVTKNDKTLIGSSYGGLFTLYALFHETALFHRYVLTSPSLGWDNGITSTYEKNRADKEHQLPVRLFMAIGELEGISGFQNFADRLKARNYEGLEFQTRVLEGMGHSGGKAEGYSRGLQAVFARASLTLDTSVLEQYVGLYQHPSGAKFTISTEDGRLIARTPDNSKQTFLAETGTDFYVKGQRLLIHFKKDSAGKVMGFLVERYGGEEFVKKVN
ncbi:MAG: alpha/beta hydrolase-fold protein [Ignavibacteriales bacterium]|nr:alpha/beta hydrolase-fold protein [Ignavibacteriales bacterium]